MSNIEPGHYVLRAKAFKADGSLETCYSIKYYVTSNEFLSKAKKAYLKVLQSEGYVNSEITGIIYQEEGSKRYYPTRGI